MSGRSRAVANESLLGSVDEVKAIKVHHLVPDPNEIMHELLVRVLASIDLRKSPELSVRAKDEIGASGCPLHLS